MDAKMPCALQVFLSAGHVLKYTEENVGVPFRRFHSEAPGGSGYNLHSKCSKCSKVSQLKQKQYECKHSDDTFPLSLTPIRATIRAGR